MIGLLCVLALWAPNADIPLLDAAVAQVKADRPTEALRILEPIAQSPARVEALASPDRLLLFYTLGRAYEDDMQWCAAHDAFGRALRVSGATPREARRLKTARRRVAGRRRGKMQVECAQSVLIDGSRRTCPTTLTDLESGEEIEARADLDSPPARARARVCRTVILRVIDDARQIGDSERPARAEDPLPWKWVAVGVMGTAAATTGVMALIKRGQHADLQDRVRSGQSTNRAGVFALEDSTNRFAIASGLFVLATAGALTWALWPEEEGDTLGIYLTPNGIGGRF